MIHIAPAVAGLTVNRPHWLAAQTVSWLSTLTLIIYRSPLVKDTHTWYRPILETMSKFYPQLVLREVFDSPVMMYGEGEASVYLLKDSPREMHVSADDVRSLRKAFLDAREHILGFIDRLDEPVDVPVECEVFLDRGIDAMGLLPLLEGSHEH